MSSKGPPSLFKYLMSPVYIFGTMRLFQISQFLSEIIISDENLSFFNIHVVAKYLEK